MTESLDRSFGLTIAFLLPGFVCLIGFSNSSPTLTEWLTSEPRRTPGGSGFLYVVLGSLATGLIVSAVRWAVIDYFHHATGLALPVFNFSRLTEHLLSFRITSAVRFTLHLRASVAASETSDVMQEAVFVTLVPTGLILKAASSILPLRTIGSVHSWRRPQRSSLVD